MLREPLWGGQRWDFQTGIFFSKMLIFIHTHGDVLQPGDGSVGHKDALQAGTQWAKCLPQSVTSYVWIPRTHEKPGMVVCICNPCALMVGWEIEMAESPESGPAQEAVKHKESLPAEGRKRRTTSEVILQPPHTAVACACLHASTRFPDYQEEMKIMLKRVHVGGLANSSCQGRARWQTLSALWPHSHN